MLCTNFCTPEPVTACDPDACTDDVGGGGCMCVCVCVKSH